MSDLLNSLNSRRNRGDFWSLFFVFHILKMKFQLNHNSNLIPVWGCNTYYGLYMHCTALHCTTYGYLRRSEIYTVFWCFRILYTIIIYISIYFYVYRRCIEIYITIVYSIRKHQKTVYISLLLT